MAFTDLPPDWPTLPITRPDLLPDVLDLTVDEHDRASGALVLLLCDGSGRLVSPVKITDLADAPPGRARVETLAPIMDMLADIDVEAGVLAAIGRTGGLSATADDRGWAQALATATRGKVRLLGVHVVTADGCRPVPALRVAA